MPEFSYIILYVESADKSAKFYTDLLGKPIVDQTDGFAMLPLNENIMLGLWDKSTVLPPAGDSGSGSIEVCFNVDDDESLIKTHQAWASKDVAIVQEPADMPFGKTFVATDLDGHRIRVASPAQM